MATAADSVGVQMPVIMPPRMITGISSAQIASTNAFQTSLPDCFASVS